MPVVSRCRWLRNRVFSILSNILSDIYLNSCFCRIFVSMWVLMAKLIFFVKYSGPNLIQFVSWQVFLIFKYHFFFSFNVVIWYITHLTWIQQQQKIWLTLSRFLIPIYIYMYNRSTILARWYILQELAHSRSIGHARFYKCQILIRIIRVCEFFFF